VVNQPIMQAEGRRAEEESLLATLPPSPRLRRLLTDLETVMMTEGFLHLSTDDVAGRLKCSKATLYRLAGSREELFELVINIFLARARDTGWREFDAAKDWPGRLVGFLSAAVIATRNASFAFIRDLRSFPAGYRSLMVHQDQRDADLREIIEEGIKAGAFLDVHPALAADLLLTTMRRIIEPEFLMTVRMPITEAFDEAYRILEYGLIRPPASPKRGTRKPGGR
jgi:AcrR family transcriptional regulator